jgi:hypothetical protein
MYVCMCVYVCVQVPFGRDGNARQTAMFVNAEAEIMDRVYRLKKCNLLLINKASQT